MAYSLLGSKNTLIYNSRDCYGFIALPRGESNTQSTIVEIVMAL